MNSMLPAILLIAATYVLMLTFSKFRPYIALASVLISAFIDNIPYVATMIPVIAGIASAMGCSPIPLYFGLLSGATLGGNCTPIGASANITGIGILRKEGHQVSNGDFLKSASPSPWLPSSPLISTSG